MRKIFSVLVCLVMVCALMPATALAADAAGEYQLITSVNVSGVRICYAGPALPKASDYSVPDDAQYSVVDVIVKDSERSEITNGPLEAGKSYMVYLTIRPNEGYCFETGAAAFSINGGNTSASRSVVRLSGARQEAPNARDGDGFAYYYLDAYEVSEFNETACAPKVKGKVNYEAACNVFSGLKLPNNAVLIYINMSGKISGVYKKSNNAFSGTREYRDWDDVRSDLSYWDGEGYKVYILGSAHAGPMTTAEENRVEAACTADGSYDIVSYCSSCGKEASREKVVIPAKGHIDEDLDGRCDVCGQKDQSQSISFKDVKESDWFYDDVVYVYENGLMNGTGDDKFSPDITTTRGMIVTIIYRQEGGPAVSDPCPFGDVKTGSYYEIPITWAAENGIVKGYNEKKFGPEDSITREQMVTILYRYAQKKGMGFSGSWSFPLTFDDADAVSEYADEAMHWCIMKKIINGSNNKLDPQGNATRAQAAAILHRFSELMK